MGTRTRYLTSMTVPTVAGDPSVSGRSLSGDASDDVAVTFPYAGCTVTVTGADVVLVREGASSNPDV